MEQTRDLGTIDLQQILLSMRRQRLGLIQTADQLRFSYIAILQGALQDLELEPSNYDDLSDSDEDVPEEEDSDEESDSELMKGVTSLYNRMTYMYIHCHIPVTEDDCKWETMINLIVILQIQAILLSSVGLHDYRHVDLQQCTL